MENSCSVEKSEISDVDRVLLFEWHARHLESWRETMVPKRHSINFPRGMDTPTFHRMSTSLLLLRKFYTPKHEVKLPSVFESVAQLLPPEKRELKKTLRTQKGQFKNYLKQPDSVGAPDELRPDQIFEEILYGLMIHSDVDRHRRLSSMSRGWMHEMIILASKGHVPVLKTLKTIEECREEGTLELPAPYEAIWEQEEPVGMTLEEAQEFLEDLGFNKEDLPPDESAVLG